MARLITELSFKGEHAVKLRDMLTLIGYVSENDIVNSGCTGLAFDVDHSNVLCDEPFSVVTVLQWLREALDGSGCALTCYVPSDRFCLVHNTIGGLQRGQDLYRPEGLTLCSRVLTPEESAHVAKMAKVIQAPDERAAREALGLDEPEVDTHVGDVAPLPAPSDLHDKFRCPEHAQPIWKCRYCLAAAIIHGPFEPYVEIDRAGKGSSQSQPFTLEAFREALADSELIDVALYVRVARWSRKLVRDEG